MLESDCESEEHGAMEKKNTSPVIRLDQNDNIVIARRSVPAGTFIEEENLTVMTDVPVGHKISSRRIYKGEPVLKYNTVIGYASCDVEPGTHMHDHNIHFDTSSTEYCFCADYKPLEILPAEKQRTFMGYVRENGKVGTRNCICIIACSNCAATVVRKIADHFSEEILAEYPNVDAVIPLITSSGCGLEKTGVPMTILRKLLAGHINNPNMAGAVVCSLGCESNNIDAFMEETGLQTGAMLRRLVIQEEGGSVKALARGIELVGEMLPEADKCSRQPVSVSHLKLAMECGGSDSFSGSSANPALGIAVDMLVKNGGTAVLTEPTELIGSEGALVRRACSEETAQKLIDMMNWWKEYCKGTDSQINGKVTPGNMAGGITNILEKALGSAKKGGSTPINDVIEYAEQISNPGLNVMSSPSYDPVSAAAMFAGGCNLCAFTTGRGSCYGGQHYPTLKIASNTQLFEHQRDDMDLNAGAVIDGDKTLQQVGEEIFEALIAVASGEKTKSELFGMGSDEFVVWWRGVTA